MVVKMILNCDNEQDNCVHMMYSLLTPGMVASISDWRTTTIASVHKFPSFILSQSSVEANNLREIDELLGVEQQGTSLQVLVSGRFNDSWGTMPIPQALDTDNVWNYPAIKWPLP